jgi:hypothetical protein
MGCNFLLPLALIGFTILIFAGCWRFPGFRMLFDDSACALCLGPVKTVVWTTISTALIVYLPFALLAALFGDLAPLTITDLLLRFGGSLLACLALGLAAALVRAWKIFSPRSYWKGVLRQLRRDRRALPNPGDAVGQRQR